MFWISQGSSHLGTSRIAFAPFQEQIPPFQDQAWGSTGNIPLSSQPQGYPTEISIPKIWVGMSSYHPNPKDIPQISQSQRSGSECPTAIPNPRIILVPSQSQTSVRECPTAIPIPKTSH